MRYSGRRLRRNWASKSSIGVVGDLARGGEAADEVDDAVQRRALVAGGDLHHLVHVAGVEQVGLDELEPLALGQAVELALCDPGHDDAPVGVQERPHDRHAEAAAPARHDHRPVHLRLSFALALAVRSRAYLPSHGSAGSPRRRHHHGHRPRARGRAAAQARRHGVSPPRAGRPHGHAGGGDVGRVPRGRARLPRGRARAGVRRVLGAPALRPSARRRRGARAPCRARSRSTSSLDGPRALARRAGGRPARARRHGARAAPALPARGAAGRALAHLARVPRRARGQALPPGLPRTGCSSTRSAWPRRCRRSRRLSPASTATSPSPARCCTTSASSTPTPPTGWPST